MEGVRFLRGWIRRSYPFFWVYIGWTTLLVFAPEGRYIGAIYYCFLLLPYLLSLEKAGLYGLFNSWVVRLSLVLLVALYVSIFWNEAESKALTKLAYGLLNFSFLLLTLSVLIRDWRRQDWLFGWLGGIALVVGIVSVFQYAVNPTERFFIGHWPNINTGAAIFGMIATGLFSCLATDLNSRLRMGAFGLPALLISALVIATASRAAMVALLSAGLAVAMFVCSRRMIGVIVLVGVCALTLAVTFGMIDLGWWLSRADGGRVAVWMYYLNLVLKRPLLGYGINNEWAYKSDPGTDAPHNMFVSAFFYGGLTACAAFVFVVLVCMKIGVSRAREGSNVLPLALVVYSSVHGLFESVLPFHAPGWIWFYFWLPLAFAAAAERAVPFSTREQCN
jgi:O-antigen ligase